jgi:hypothetical protein
VPIASSDVHVDTLGGKDGVTANLPLELTCGQEIHIEQTLFKGHRSPIPSRGSFNNLLGTHDVNFLSFAVQKAGSRLDVHSSPYHNNIRKGIFNLFTKAFSPSPIAERLSSREAWPPI